MLISSLILNPFRGTVLITDPTHAICAVPDFVTWAVGHLSAVSDDPHQLCQAGRYFSSEKSKI